MTSKTKLFSVSRVCRLILLRLIYIFGVKHVHDRCSITMTELDSFLLDWKQWLIRRGPLVCRTRLRRLISLPFSLATRHSHRRPLQLV